MFFCEPLRVLRFSQCRPWNQWPTQFCQAAFEGIEHLKVADEHPDHRGQIR